MPKTSASLVLYSSLAIVVLVLMWGVRQIPAEGRLANQALHDRRLRIEHVNSSVTRCRIVKDRIRLWKEGIRDLVMELCCALHNFRVRLNPWLPII